MVCSAVTVSESGAEQIDFFVFEADINSTMKLSVIINELDRQFPLILQESYDNSGLQTGNPSDEISGILLGVDCTLKMIDAALRCGCNLLITHHPLLFSPVKKITSETLNGKKLLKLCQNGLNLLSLHTNVDSATGGINDFLAAIFSPVSVSPLLQSGEKLYKIVTFVPETHLKQVQDSLCSTGAAVCGNYDQCFFLGSGTGTFRPLSGSDPFIGSQGIFEKVSEIRLECICRQRFLGKSISEMLKAHPYEEPAYDIICLENRQSSDGIGRILNLKTEITAIEAADILSACGYTPVVHGCARTGKIAVCSGSCGSDIVRSVLSKKAEILVTGEIRHHDLSDLVEQGVSVIELTHYGSELCFEKIMEKSLHSFFQGKVFCYSHISGDNIE